jgi:hypothetical protein
MTLCKKNCIGRYCDRDIYKGNCHLLTPLEELVAIKNPSGLINAVWMARYRWDQVSQCFIRREGE